MYDKSEQGLQKYLTDRALGLTHMTLSSSVQFNKMVQGKEKIIVDGQSLDIGSVFAVARYVIRRISRPFGILTNRQQMPC
jgi:hypothetical protein